MTNIFNALENCLQEIEKGTDVESALKQYPEFASELRPILKTALKAQRIQTTEPAPETFSRGRTKVLEQAAGMRVSQPIRRKGLMPAFSRLAISFALASLFLLSGAGLFSASASALPGEKLYPVKRGWESVRLFLIFDQEARELLKNEFENERLHEVSELLSQGKNAEIQFAGIFMQVNSMDYVSGVPVVLLANVQIPAGGDIVSVTGFTNPQGWVDISAVEILPTGTTVPVGNPIEVINENDEIESGGGSENEAVEVVPQVVYYDIQGVLQVISESELVINGLTVYLNNPQIDGQLCVGRLIQVSGYYESDGRFIVTRIVGAESCSGNSGNNNINENENDDANDNSNDDDDNSNDNDNDNSDSGSNSGSGGGGSDDDGDDD